MKKRMLLSLLFTLMLLCSFVLHPLAAGLPSASDDFYVNDFANVLSEETEQHILEINDQLQPETGAQIVVVAVDFLGGLNSEEYGYQLFNQWGIGSKDKNNGVLLLISPGEEKFWVTVGRGLETTLSSGRLSMICDSDVEAYFDDGEYDLFVTAMFDGIAELLADHYNISLSENADVTLPVPGYNDDYYPEEYYYEEPSIVTLIFFFILLLIVVSIIRSWLRAFGPMATHRRRIYTPRIRIPHVYHMPRRTVHRPRPPRPPSSFGGFGGMSGGRPSRPSSFGSSSARRNSSFGGSSRGSSGRAPRSGGGGGSRGGGFGRK